MIMISVMMEFMYSTLSLAVVVVAGRRRVWFVVVVGRMRVWLVVVEGRRVNVELESIEFIQPKNSLLVPFSISIYVYLELID